MSENVSSEFIAAILCLCVYAYLYMKAPAGITHMGLTTSGLAGANFGPLNYAKIVFILQSFLVLKLLMELARSRRSAALLRFPAQGYSLAVWALSILWLKILLDVVVGGLDSYRIPALLLAPNTIILPSFILAGTIIKNGGKKVSRDFVMGMLLFAIAYTIPDLINSMNDGRILLAATGLQRFSLYELDTINGARLLFIGTSGSFGLAFLSTRSTPYRNLLLLLSVGFFIALALNGTRQYIFASLILFFVTYTVNSRSSAKKLGAAITALTAIIFAISQAQQFDITANRLSFQNVTNELEHSRGQIWLDAIRVGFDSPFYGTGFRRYGEEVQKRTSEGSYIKTLSGAHGFFQTVFSEHGLFIFIVTLCSFVYVGVISVRRCILLKSPEITLFFIIIFTLSIPLFFSGGVLNATPLYFLAVAQLIWQTQRVKSEAIPSKLKAKGT